MVLRGTAVVLVGRGRCGRREVRMGVRVRMVDASHVVRVLLELDERRLGRGYRRYAAAAAASAAAARVLVTAARVVAARAVGSGRAATAGRRSAGAERGRVHRVTAGHRRRRPGGPLLLLLLVGTATTAAPSERAPDLPVIQRDGRRVQRTGGIINLVPRRRVGEAVACGDRKTRVLLAMILPLGLSTARRAPRSAMKSGGRHAGCGEHWMHCTGPVKRSVDPVSYVVMYKFVGRVAASR